MPHLHRDLITWSMWRQHAYSSSTKLRITCKKKKSPSSSRWKLWKVNTHDQWSPISSIHCLLFSFSIFRLHFLHFLACLTDLFLLFAGIFEYFHPWSWLQNLSLGVVAWFYYKLWKFSVQLLYFYFVSYYLFIFFICILIFSDIGDNV